MLTTGVRTPVGHQDLRRRHPRDRADRHRDRVGPAVGLRHAQRVRRADVRRLLRRLRLEARRAGALRPVDRRRPDGGDVRDRRRHRDDDGRRPRAVRGERAVLPRLPQRRRPAAARDGAGDGRPDADPGRPARRREAGERAGDAAQRERHADRLCLRGRRRPRHRRLRHRGEARDRRARQPAGRLLAGLERPVRGDGAGARAAEDRRCRSRCCSC